MRLSILVAVLVLIPLSSAEAQIPPIERDALIALYNSTDGANWTVKTGWLGAAGTECGWYLVQCAGGHVERLYLSSNNLNGNLPPELGDLSNLVGMQLWSNQLSGSIPPQLGGLSYLSDLGLSSNQLSGSIPPQLGSLSSLQDLDISSNQLDGAIPSELGNLANLAELDLSFNQLSGSIPPNFENLSSMLYMEISSNQLDGSIPPELGNMASLEELDLSSNQLSGAIPPALADPPNLRRLNLSSNQLSGAIPPALASMPTLEHLYLSSNQLSGAIPPLLGSLSTLRYLYLDSNQLSGAIPPELAFLNLGELYLSSNQLSGVIPPQLGSVLSLRHLHLASNRLSGDIPAELEDLTNLYDDRLDLRWNALHSNNTSLIAFLDDKQVGGDWQSTQTIAPVNPTIDSVDDHTVWLSWDAVSYQTDPGGYSVFSTPTGSGVWTAAGWTEAKTDLTYPVTGLNPGTTYDFAVVSYTDPHSNNPNVVNSDFSPSVMATTSNTGCARPTLVVAWEDPITVSVSESFDTYLWSTGATTSAIDITAIFEQWYWVTVTSAGSCEDTAAVSVDPNAPVFFDGFESGDTVRWSIAVP